MASPMDILKGAGTSVRNRATAGYDYLRSPAFTRKVARISGAVEATGIGITRAYGIDVLEDASRAYVRYNVSRWETMGGARRAFGKHVIGGAIFGMAMAGFKLNRDVDMANARRVEEQGSAYEGGAGAFGGGRGGGRMPYASGKVVLGLQNRRNG